MSAYLVAAGDRNVITDEPEEWVDRLQQATQHRAEVKEIFCCHCEGAFDTSTDVYHVQKGYIHRRCWIANLPKPEAPPAYAMGMED